jgi:hypothetical protein
MGRVLHDWAGVQADHDDGHGFVECRRKLGFSHTAWVKAIKSRRLRSKATPFKDRRRKYDWGEIRAYHEAATRSQNAWRVLASAQRRGKAPLNDATSYLSAVVTRVSLSNPYWDRDHHGGSRSSDFFERAS